MLITLTILPSEEQLLSGIPKDVLVETDIPATVFYTLDGSIPTISSSIYLDKIILPTDQGLVVLKLFATNGSDSSEVITQTYQTNVVPGRHPHDKIENPLTCQNQFSNFPYGDQNYTPMPYVFANTGGLTVDDPDKPNLFDGYDGTASGTWRGGTDQPLETYPLIGAITAKVKVRKPASESSQTSLNEAFFNPRAMLLFQDNTKPSAFPEMNTIRGQHFNLSPDPSKDRIGIEVRTLAQDSGPMHGNMLRTQYNPRDNTYTDYLFDSRSLRWVIVKEPAPSKPNPAANLSNMIFDPREKGLGKIMRWRPFGRRHLL